MFKKICYSCKGDSYSAASQSKWICPYCQADLTNAIPLSACPVKNTDSAKDKVVYMQEFRNRAEKVLPK